MWGLLEIEGRRWGLCIEGFYVIGFWDGWVFVDIGDIDCFILGFCLYR